MNFAAKIRSSKHFRSGAITRSKSFLIFLAVATLLTGWLGWAIISTPKGDLQPKAPEANSGPLTPTANNDSQGGAPKPGHNTLSVIINPDELAAEQNTGAQPPLSSPEAANPSPEASTPPWAVTSEVEVIQSATPPENLAPIFQADSPMAQVGEMLNRQADEQDKKAAAQKAEAAKAAETPPKVTEAAKTAPPKSPEKKAAKPEPSKPAVKPTAKKQTFTVQLGSFTSKENAEKLQKRLKAQGESAFIMQGAVSGKIWYRVMSGRFESDSQASAHEKKLISKKLITKDASNRIKSID